MMVTRKINMTSLTHHKTVFHYKVPLEKYAFSINYISVQMFGVGKKSLLLNKLIYLTKNTVEIVTVIIQCKTAVFYVKSFRNHSNMVI